MVQIGKFGEFVEKAHARIYKTQTKDWMGQPELAGVKAALDKVSLKELFTNLFSIVQISYFG